MLFKKRHRIWIKTNNKGMCFLAHHIHILELPSVRPFALNFLLERATNIAQN
jgi:hypothetical protein